MKQNTLKKAKVEKKEKKTGWDYLIPRTLLIRGMSDETGSAFSKNLCYEEKKSGVN